MKKQLSLLLMSCLLSVSSAWARDFQDADTGLWFNKLSDSTCEVTYSNNYVSTDYSAESYVIPETVTYNGVTYTVTTVGKYAFKNSTTKSVTIPSTVTTIDYNVFYGMKNLESLVIPNSVTSCGSSFAYNNTALTSITLSENVTSYADYSLAYSKALTELTIPDATTFLGDNFASSCTALKTVRLGSGITQMYATAFSSAPLTDVYITATTPPTFTATVPSTISTNAFKSVDSACVLHVPAESVEAYKADAIWGAKFASIEAISEEGTTDPSTDVATYTVNGIGKKDGVLAQNITVKLANDENEYTTYTDYDGEFSFLNVKKGTYTLTASCDGYRSYTQEVEVADNVKLASFSLEQCLTVIQGYVYAGDSDVVVTTADIQLTCGTYGPYHPNDMKGENEDMFYYTWPGAFTSSYILKVTAAGYKDYEKDLLDDLVIDAENNIIVRLEAVPTVIVAGTVKSGDAAVAGAAVALYAADATEASYTATTDENGAFTLAGVLPATYTLTATAEGYEDYSQELAVSADTTGLAIELTAAQTGDSVEVTDTEDFNNWYTSGQYLTSNTALLNDWYCLSSSYSTWNQSAGIDGSGCIYANSSSAVLVAPVKAGSISFAAKRQSTYQAATANLYKVTKNADGSFTKGDLIGALTDNNVTTAWGGTYSYSDIEEDGYVALELKNVYMDNFSNTYKVSGANPTPTSYTVSGNVTIYGMGFPGVTVKLADKENEENVYSAVTDTNGSFTLKEVTPATYTLTATCSGYRTYSSELEVAGDVSNISIAMEISQTIIKGVVYAGESENGVKDAKISINDGVNTYETTSGEDGTFQYPAMSTISDSYTLTVTADGYKDYSEEIKPVIDTENSYTIRLELATYSVAGTVKSGDAAVAGAAVALYAAEATEASYTATTDENGAFTFADVLPATYTLTATAEGYEDYSQELTVSADTADLAIELTAQEQGGETVLVNMESEIQDFEGWNSSMAYLRSLSSDKFTLGYGYISDTSGSSDDYIYYQASKKYGVDNSACIFGGKKATSNTALVIPVKGGVGGATIKFQAKKGGNTFALSIYKVTKNADGSYTRGSKIGDVDASSASTQNYIECSYTIEDITSSEDGQYVGLYNLGYYVDNIQNTWVEEQVVASSYELAGDVYCGSDMFAGITVKLDDTETVTDADGHYSFTKVAPGTHTLTVNKIDGYLAYSEKFELEEDDIRHDIEIEAEKSYVNIAATYYDSWSFIEGVNIKVYNSQDELVGEYTSGDAEFSIAFEGLLDADGYYFTAEKEGYMLTAGYNNHVIVAKRDVPALTPGGTASNKAYVSMIDSFTSGDMVTTNDNDVPNIRIEVSNADDNALTIADATKAITLSSADATYTLVATEEDGKIVLTFGEDSWADGTINLNGFYTLTIPAGTLAENGVPYGFDYTNMYSMDDVTVSVGAITLVNSELVDVYTTAGMMIRRQMTAAELNTLPDGLYIIRTANKAVKYLKR